MSTLSMRNMVRRLLLHVPAHSSTDVYLPSKGPIVRVGPNEVDVMDIPSAKEIHTVKATYTKSPGFCTYRSALWRICIMTRGCLYILVVTLVSTAYN